MGAPVDNVFKADSVGQQQHAGVINGISVHFLKVCAVMLVLVLQ